MDSIFSGEARDLVDRSARPQSLIITIYAAYSRSNGGWFSANTIIQLCAELDVAEDAARSALARFKRRGILISKKQNGVIGYAISPEMRKSFDQVMREYSSAAILQLTKVGFWLHFQFLKSFVPFAIN